MKTTKEQQESFKIAAKPLVQWMADNCHPHCKVIVEIDRVELLEGIITTICEVTPE